MMLQNVKPNRKKSKDGGLTKQEVPLVKGLLQAGYNEQDVTYIVNLGRITTVNQSRINSVCKDNLVSPAAKDAVQEYLNVQSSYDPKTLLNPYKDSRLIRAREAMICAVQIFNNPAIIFKTETFCVLANIAWTYLLHEKMERTKNGSSKLQNGDSVTLNGTLDKEICPIKDAAVRENLNKITDIRNAVEHTFFVGGEECFGRLFQACCVNFERYMTDWFGAHLTLAKELSLALQFVSIQKEQFVELERSDLPPKIVAIYQSIQASDFKNNNAFQATVYYGLENSSRTSADIHKLVKYDDEKSASTTHVIKPYKPTKKTEKQIVANIKKKGFQKFSAYHHQQFWKTKWRNASERNKNAHEYGELVINNQWLWYEDKWFPQVETYCKDAGEKFK
jgi:hypothetical protein